MLPEDTGPLNCCRGEQMVNQAQGRLERGGRKRGRGGKRERRRERTIQRLVGFSETRVLSDGLAFGCSCLCDTVAFLMTVSGVAADAR